MPIPNVEFAKLPKPVPTYPQLVTLIRQEIQKSTTAIQQIKVLAYWNVGGYINSHILSGKNRADYGKQLYQRLSKDLQINERTLQQTAKFQRSFPIPNGRSEFKWTHYRSLLQISDSKLRTQLFKKVEQEGLNTTQLQKEIKALALKSSAATQATLPASTPGPLHTYRLDAPAIATVQPGYRVVDCGFGFWRQIPAQGLDALSEGAIVESHTNETWFQLEESARKTSDLYTYRAGLDYVIDGDTVVVQVDLGFRSFSRQKLRLRGIDTPELNTPQGQEAKAFVQEKLKRAAQITIKTYRKDKYDRYLADIFVGPNQSFLNQILLDEGYATLYNK